MMTNLVKSVMDVFAPRTCCVCGQRLSVDEDIICTVCMLNMPFTPFLDNPYENDMVKELWGRVKHIEKAFALIYHLPHSSSAHPVYQLKYSNKPDIGYGLGKLMGKMMKEKHFADDIDCLLPVPLARNRERQRGYNQSKMLAYGMHDVLKLPVVDDVVKRTSFNGSQTKKDHLGRAENVENVFQLVNGDKIKDRHILIIDDVVTTGATVCAIAKQLEKVEGVKISVASLGYAGVHHIGA